MAAAFESGDLVKLRDGDIGFEVTHQSGERVYVRLAGQGEGGDIFIVKPCAIELKDEVGFGKVYPANGDEITFDGLSPPVRQDVETLFLDILSKRRLAVDRSTIEVTRSLPGWVVVKWIARRVTTGGTT